MIRLKKGVRLAGVRPEIAFILPVIDGVYSRFRVSECWITSVCEGKHSPTSRHYLGAAIDLRTRNVPAGVQIDLKEALQDALGKDFFVLLEVNHIHIGFKPRQP